MTMFFDVIIPIYRVSEELLRRCFDSVKSQSFQDIAVFVCDGAPTEENRQLVEGYGFHYLEQGENYKRVGGARNQAIAAGAAPYLAFLDGDD